MKAEVRVDAYPGRFSREKLFRIGQTATSKFALLPDPIPAEFHQDHAALPVRIVLTEKDPALRRA
jgi:membrane fusion protein (multidrug efflux system)